MGGWAERVDRKNGGKSNIFDEIGHRTGNWRACIVKSDTTFAEL